jgi:hypothetical protein
VRHLKSPVSPSNPIHNADDCGKDYEGSGTEITNASRAVVPRSGAVRPSPRGRPRSVAILRPSGGRPRGCASGLVGGPHGLAARCGNGPIRVRRCGANKTIRPAPANADARPVGGVADRAAVVATVAQWPPSAPRVSPGEQLTCCEGVSRQSPKRSANAENYETGGGMADIWSYSAVSAEGVLQVSGRRCTACTCSTCRIGAWRTGRRASDSRGTGRRWSYRWATWRPRRTCSSCS